MAYNRNFAVWTAGLVPRGGPTSRP